MDNGKSQFSPLTYILIGVVVVLLIQYLSSSHGTQSSTIFTQPAAATENPYKDCISWQQTEYHDGETVCVIGKVVFVNKTYDDLSGQTIWGVRFSMSNDSFHLVSVGDSLDEWQDKCVVVRGTLRDRSKVEAQFRDGPWMINSDMGSDFSIREGPAGLCP